MKSLNWKSLFYLTTYIMSLLNPIARAQMMGECKAISPFEDNNSILCENPFEFNMPLNADPLHVEVNEEEDQLQRICNFSEFKTANKPNITIGAQNDLVAPQSCIKHEAACNEEAELYLSYRTNGLYQSLNEVQLIRQEIDSTYMSWISEVHQVFTSRLFADMKTESQNKTCQSIMKKLERLKQIFVQADTFLKYKIGNCGEHSCLAAKRLIENNIKFGTPLKIQVVTAEHSHTRNNHEYLLLQSNVDDVKITQDAKKIKSFLNKIRQGKICDPWNKGFYGDFKHNNNGLYHKGMQWDNIEVVTISFDYNQDLKEMPKSFQRFICKELIELGISINTHEICKTFSDVKSRAKEISKIKAKEKAKTKVFGF